MANIPGRNWAAPVSIFFITLKGKIGEIILDEVMRSTSNNVIMKDLSINNRYFGRTERILLLL
jgi:hypothetical protein